MIVYSTMGTRNVVQQRTDISQDVGMMRQDSAGLSLALAEFASSMSLAQIPESVRTAGRRIIANSICLSTGAVDHPAVVRARKAIAALGDGDQASILGTDELAPAPFAALVNGMGAHVEDFDDTHLATVVHPGAPVVSAALATAQLCGASGQDLLAGVIAGVEVALRVGLALGDDHFNRGWHLTGTAGHVGAAVAAARVLRLDAAQTLTAIALGATQAAGLQEALGTMVKCLHAGKAAADGVEAAVLAAEGLDGPSAPLEGRRGLLALTTSASNPRRGLEDLGSVWEVELNAFKPYACGIVSHPVIDAGIALGAAVGRDPSVVDSVQVTVNPVVLDVMGVEQPKDGLHSKFSVYHCFTVGFLDGEAGPRQFNDARATAPEAVALRSRVTVILNPAIRRDECLAMLRTFNGDISHHVVHATGSAESPMTDNQLRAKAVLVAGPVLSDVGASRLFDQAMSVDKLRSADALAASAKPLQSAIRREGDRVGIQGMSER